MDKLHVYPLFLGITRPPMMWGVGQTYAVLNFGLGIIVLMVFKSFLLAGGLFVLAHLAGVVGYGHDAAFFEIQAGKLGLACPNRKLWGCASYDPS